MRTGNIQEKSSTIKKLVNQATNNAIDKFNNTFPKETTDLLDMFSWLCLSQIRRKVKSATDLKTFKREVIR